MRTADILVIGGGVAGVSAALAAASAGADVTLVRATPGVTAMSCGGWIDAPPPALRLHLQRAGLHLVDCDAPLADPRGLLRPCACADTSHACASIDPDVTVVGIAGLPGFRPHALARLWGASRDAATLTLPDTPPAGWSAASLAQYIDRTPQAFADALRRSIPDARRVILPAVLGLVRSHAATISEAAGINVAEALGGVPSIPGWRLDLTLQRALAAAGVTVLNGCVTSRTTVSARVQSVTIGADTVNVRACVLATGKFAAGGIGAESGFAENALGCDVALYRFGRTFDDAAESLALTDPVRTEPQPILGVGIRTDANARPLNRAGDVTLHNVFVAGSVRADTAAATLGLGAAAHEGWNAGVRAANARD